LVLRHARAQRPPWVPVHDGGSAVARRPLHTLSLSQRRCQPRGGARTCACERCETRSAPAPAPAPCRVPRRGCSRPQKAPLTLSWYPSQRRPASTGVIELLAKKIIEYRVHVFLVYSLHRTVGAASLESQFYSGRANVPRLSLYRAQLDESRQRGNPY
jgi:hypothetical protein